MCCREVGQYVPLLLEHSEILLETTRGVVERGPALGFGPCHLTLRATMTGEVLGLPDLLSMGDIAYAHTCPVRVLIGGSGVARPDDVAWCLEWLDPLRVFVAQQVRGIDGYCGRREPVFRCRVSHCSVVG